MKLIERYIFRRVLSLSLTTLGATTAIVLTTQVLLRVNILTQTGESLATFMKLAAFLVPSMVMVVLPFALLIGAAQTLNAMNTDSELAVIEAAGGSNILVARPIVLIAFLMTFTSLGISLFVEPYSNRSLREIISAASADIVRFAVQAGSFRKVSDKLYIQVDEQLPGGDLGGIFIVDQRDRQTELIYYARRGSIRSLNDDDFLLMERGEIQRKDTQSGSVSTISFTSYALDFSTFEAGAKTRIYFPKERSTAYLLHPDPDDPVAKDAPALLRSELHRRFSDWLYPLAFGLIAIYFGGTARSNREERLWGLGLAMLIALAFRGGGYFAANNSGKSAVFAVMTYAVPLSAIAVFAFLVLRHKSARVAQAWVDAASSLADSFMNTAAAARSALGGGSRPGGRP